MKAALALLAVWSVVAANRTRPEVNYQTVRKAADDEVEATKEVVQRPPPIEQQPMH